MSADPGGDTRSNKEGRRIAFEDALLAFRPDLLARNTDLVGRTVPEPEAALERLAGTDIPRLLKHRVVLDGLLRSRTRWTDGVLDRAVDVLYSTIPEPRRSSVRIGQLRSQLSMLSGERPRQRQWDDWVRATDAIFNYNLHERTFSACNDSVIALKRRCTDEDLVDSALIVGEFVSALPPADFGGYVEPTEWPRISVFWKAMTPLDPYPTPVDDGTALGYNRTFRETVNVFSEEITVPLTMAVRARHDGSRVWVRFNVAREQSKDDVPVDVDTGTVSAESIAGGRTLVRATKYINWRKVDKNDLVSLLCDFGWVELMAEMAERSLATQPHASAGGAVSAPHPGPADPVENAVKCFVEGVATDYKHGVDQAVPGLQSLLERFTGNAWDPRWLNDWLAIAQVSVDGSGSFANRVRRLADDLRAQGQQRHGDG